MTRPADIPDRCEHGIRWPWQCDDCDRLHPIPSRCQSTPPLAGSPSGPTVPGDETVTPFGPVADIVGAPIRAFPHRLAKTVRDDESYNRLRAGQRDYARVAQWQREADAAADELAAQIGDVVIAIGLGVMFVCAFVMWFA